MTIKIEVYRKEIVDYLAKNPEKYKTSVTGRFTYLTESPFLLAYILGPHIKNSLAETKTRPIIPSIAEPKVYTHLSAIEANNIMQNLSKEQ